MDLYTPTVLCAQSFHEKFIARASPSCLASFRHDRLSKLSRSAVATSSTSSGLTNLAAPPATSGIHETLEVITGTPLAMRREHPLVMAGSRGWHSDQIHKQMEIGRAEGWVHYLSFVSQAHLPLLYAGAALFAYPSLYEGFGLPIAEAMASGVPVITSGVSCMPEVAGGAAKLINPLDLEDISFALRECLDSGSWRKQARKQGIARAAGFSWDQCAQQTVDVYASIR